MPDGSAAISKAPTRLVQFLAGRGHMPVKPIRWLEIEGEAGVNSFSPECATILRDR